MSDETDNDSDEVRDLTAGNSAAAFGAYEERYVLPALPTLPAVAVTVKSASFARISQFVQAEESGNDRKRLKATCALIAECVFGGDGNRIWPSVNVPEMTAMNCSRFMDLQRVVIKHNGLDRDRDIEALVEDEAGN